MALAATRYAVTYPESTDFAGVAATHQAQAADLGCIYSRSVQLAGVHLVPGVVAPPVPADLIWHFNEPPIMTLLAAPFAAVRGSTGVNLWELVVWVAIAACAVLLWRTRDGLSPWVTAAVVAALLLNLIANTEFGLAQNDALLLIAALLAIDLLRKHQDLAAGLLLGLVAVKPQLIFLAVIALVIHQRWRVLAGCAATVAAIGSVSIFMVGPACSLEWLGSATKLEEFQIGIGLPGTVARLTGSAAATEIVFLLLAVIAVAVLIGIRRRVDTPHLAIIAIALAVVVGLHTLAYDVVFLAPLGMLVAQSRPWSVVVAGWVFTVAQLIYPDGPGPVFATELVVFVAVVIGVILVVQNGTPSAENQQGIAAGGRRLVATI
jgi:glycosyl transferase family 87